jgi:hypothetical protein
VAIECVLTLKVLYQVPLRAAQGVAGSLICLAALRWLDMVDYCRIADRQQD